MKQPSQGKTYKKWLEGIQTEEKPATNLEVQVSRQDRRLGIEDNKTSIPTLIRLIAWLGAGIAIVISAFYASGGSGDAERAIHREIAQVDMLIAFFAAFSIDRICVILSARNKRPPNL